MNEETSSMPSDERGKGGRASSPTWSPVALAWSFLTTFPAPFVEPGPGDHARALILFPLVGVGLGALLGGLGLGLDRVLPPGPVAVLLLAAGALATGGLHLDGLMDSADGVFGGKTVQRRLEIMRDSRIGSFGAIAGGLALLGQFTCLGELTGVARLVAIVLAFGLSRWAMALAIGLFPPARPEGLGATFQRSRSRVAVAIATVVALGIAIAGGIEGVAALGVTLAVTLLGGRFLVGRLGGLTGDSYGALAVVAETAVLFVAVSFRGVGGG